MPTPPDFNRDHSFLDDETAGDPPDGNALDRNFDAVSETTNRTIDELSKIQRSDGALANGVVTEASLEAGLFDSLTDDALAEINPQVAAAQDAASSALNSSGSAAASADQAADAAAASAGYAENSRLARDASTAAAESSRTSEVSAGIHANDAGNYSNHASGEAAAASLSEEMALKWAEYLAGPVLPPDPQNPVFIPPGSDASWVEAVDDGHFSARWWAWWVSSRYGSPSGVSPGGGGSWISVDQAGHGLEVLDCIYQDGSGFYSKAMADSPATTALGVVVSVTSSDVFVWAQNGELNYTHGLTPQSWYYLSDTVPGGLDLLAGTSQQKVLWAESDERLVIYTYESRDGYSYAFNGVDQYAVHGAWSTLGNPSVYPPEFRYFATGSGENIVDEDVPITEFGRVSDGAGGYNYFGGRLNNLEYRDVSPLNGKTAMAGPVVIPEVLLESAEITFDIAYTVGEQLLLTGNAAPNPPVGAPTGNQIFNSDFLGTSGTEPAGTFVAPTGWTEGEWPPSQAYTNANASDYSIGFQPLYGATTGRGYLYQTIDTTGLVGQRFNLSCSIQIAIASVTNPPITAVGDCIAIRNEIPSVAGRYDSVFEITGNSVEIRIGAGVLEDDQCDILVFRSQLTYGEALEDYEGTDTTPVAAQLAADTPILGTTGDGTLVIGANVDSVVVDGSPASAPLTGHQRVTVQVSQGTLTQIGEISAMANVVVNNYAY